MTNHDRIPVAGARRLACLILALAGLTAACQTKPAVPPVSASAWAVVNGHEITRDDVEKAYRRSAPTAQPIGDDEVFAARLVLLDDLILQDLFLAKVRDLKILVPESDLDTAYAEARKNVPEEAFTQELAKRSLTVSDLREALRRDMVVQKLFAREVSSRIFVTDQEISAYFEANKPEFNRTENAYRIAQIVITPVAEAQIANRTGSDATTPEASKAKLQMIMDKLKAGAQFQEVAADFSEDPQSAGRGGDLGFLPVSAIQQYPPQLRDAVFAAKPGSAKVLGSNGGYVIVVVLGTDSAGQKDLGTPGVKDGISQSLKSRREQLLRTAYISNLRNGAVVENLIAKRIVESQGKVPTLGLAAPGAK
jgi:parvulin-like peptidyl-prolyl isomerase